MSVSITAVISNTSYTLSGFTSPNSIVYFSENGLTLGTTVSDQNGYYSRYFSVINPRNHVINVSSTDILGNHTPTVQIHLQSLVQQELTITGANLPPTIITTADRYKDEELIVINGYAAPNVSIEVIFLEGSEYVYHTTSDESGKYAFSISANKFENGQYDLKTRISTNSFTGAPQYSFEKQIVIYNTVTKFEIVKKTPGSCIYKYPKLCILDPKQIGYLDDPEVMIDFLDGFKFYLNYRADLLYDINSDGIIDPQDLSIVLYYWKGDVSLINEKFIKGMSSDIGIQTQQYTYQERDNDQVIQGYLFFSMIVLSILLFTIIFGYLLRSRCHTQRR